MSLRTPPKDRRKSDDILPSNNALLFACTTLSLIVLTVELAARLTSGFAIYTPVLDGEGSAVGG